jgi:hypothetical protein
MDVSVEMTVRGEWKMKKFCIDTINCDNRIMMMIWIKKVKRQLQHEAICARTGDLSSTSHGCIADIKYTR